MWNVSQEGHRLLCATEAAHFLLPLFFPLPVFLMQHPPILLCLCLLLWTAKSVMVTALPVCSVGLAGSFGLFDTKTLASAVLGRCCVLHPRSPLPWVLIE